MEKCHLQTEKLSQQSQLSYQHLGLVTKDEGTVGGGIVASGIYLPSWDNERIACWILKHVKVHRGLYGVLTPARPASIQKWPLMKASHTLYVITLVLFVSFKGLSYCQSEPILSSP